MRCTWGLYRFLDMGAEWAEKEWQEGSQTGSQGKWLPRKTELAGYSGSRRNEKSNPVTSPWMLAFLTKKVCKAQAAPDWNVDIQWDCTLGIGGTYPRDPMQAGTILGRQVLLSFGSQSSKPRLPINNVRKAQHVQAGMEERTRILCLYPLYVSVSNRTPGASQEHQEIDWCLISPSRAAERKACPRLGWNKGGKLANPNTLLLDYDKWK